MNTSKSKWVGRWNPSIVTMAASLAPQQVVTEDGSKVWIWKLVEWNKAVYDEKTGDEISINFQADTAEELINKCDDD